MNNNNNYHIQHSKSAFINISNIKNGKDKRTSVIIKNLPYNIDKDYLLNVWLINSGNINYSFLPFNKKTGNHLGFAFWNVVNYKSIITLYERVKSWDSINNNAFTRPIEIWYSKAQGKTQLSLMFKRK
ncbi:MAG: hypothetical protein ACRC42_00030 [Mycoplasma sp.]